MKPARNSPRALEIRTQVFGPYNIAALGARASRAAVLAD